MEQTRPSNIIINRFLSFHNIFKPYMVATPRRSLRYVNRVAPLKCNPQEG